MKKTKSFGVAAVLCLGLTVTSLAGDIGGGKKATGDIGGGKASVAGDIGGGKKAAGDIGGGKAGVAGDIGGGFRAAIIAARALLGI